jgi:hypothetical protein
MPVNKEIKVIPLPRDPENQGIDCSYSPSLERYTR